MRELIGTKPNKTAQRTASVLAWFVLPSVAPMAKTGRAKKVLRFFHSGIHPLHLRADISCNVLTHLQIGGHGLRDLHEGVQRSNISCWEEIQGPLQIALRILWQALYTRRMRISSKITHLMIHSSCQPSKLKVS